jgi:hypothetical protein
LFVVLQQSKEKTQARKADQLEQALKPKDTFENTLEKARLVLPQIMDEKKWSNQGRINIPEVMKLLKVGQNTAYRIRRELLRDFDQQKEARASQWGNDTTAEKTI